jgi:outer membrane lipoprotein-sorting protein
MRHAFTTLAVVLAGVLLAAQMAMAQDKDPRITELVEKMKADMEAGKTAEIEMTMTFELVGLPTPPQLQQPMVMQMWRDHDNTRVEMAQGNVVVVIKDNEMTMYQGMVGFALHIAPDAMAQLKAQQEQVLKGLGLPQDPDEMITMMLEKGFATITGEEAVDDVDCWVIEISPESLDAVMGAGGPMAGMTGGMGGGAGGMVPKLTQMAMLLDKATAVPKRMDMGLSLTQPNGIAMQMSLQMAFTKYAYGMEIPAELFTFEIPDGVKVVEWTVDKPMDQMMQEIQAAAMEGMQQMQQQGQQQQGQ